MLKKLVEKCKKTPSDPKPVSQKKPCRVKKNYDPDEVKMLIKEHVEAFRQKVSERTSTRASMTNIQRLDLMLDTYLLKAIDYERENNVRLCSFEDEPAHDYNHLSHQSYYTERSTPRVDQPMPVVPKVIAPIVSRQIGGISSAKSTPSVKEEPPKPKVKRVTKKKVSTDA